jgi:peptide/nickel transport system substrate-binding protein
LKSLKPIPKHIFANIPFAHMKLSNYNLEPIGSGIFTFSGFSEQKDGFITSINLKKNESFPDTKSHLSSFIFKFYHNENDAIDGFNSGDIDGFAINDPKKLSSLYTPHQILNILMSRYYAIFLNPAGNPLLKDYSIKSALNYTTDKKTIINKVFNNYALPIEGPVLIDNNNWDNQNEFSIEKANQILDAAGWTINSDGVREIKDKNSLKKLEFAITVYPAPFLIETIKIIKNDWEKIGVKININTPSPSNFEQNIIKSRNYDMLAFGNIYGENLDLFSFWHSSQKFYPGLNLSVYDNKNADFLIELIRTDFDQNKRIEELKKLQSIIEADQPAIFLYSPYYVYVSTKKLKGFDDKNIGIPSDRFLNIQNWYVKTARILK